MPDAILQNELFVEIEDEPPLEPAGGIADSVEEDNDDEDDED